MIKRIKFITAIPGLLIGILKKSKFDNFVTGLIFGSIFSLLVNIYTVKIQESVSRQRALEALEREIKSHLLVSKDIATRVNKVVNSDSSDYIVDRNLMEKRYSTKVWDSGEIDRYVFELEPSIGARLYAYYDASIKTFNAVLDQNEGWFREVFKPCEPFYNIITEKEAYSIKDCNDISKHFASNHMIPVKNFNEPFNAITEIFHPTQDRLNSKWLRFLLGGDSMEIMK